MVPPDSADSSIDFLKQVDATISASGKKPTDVLPESARELFLKIRAAYERICESMDPQAPNRLLEMVGAIEEEVEGVQFTDDDTKGFFVIPGVERDALKIAYIDWEKATVGETFSPALADVWEIPQATTGLVWVDENDPTNSVQTHFPEHGFHTTQGGFNYGKPHDLAPHDEVGMPKVYFGPCLETTSKNDPLS